MPGLEPVGVKYLPQVERLLRPQLSRHTHIHICTHTCRQMLYRLSHQGSPYTCVYVYIYTHICIYWGHIHIYTYVYISAAADIKNQNASLTCNITHQAFPLLCNTTCMQKPQKWRMADSEIPLLLPKPRCLSCTLTQAHISVKCWKN